MTITNEDQPPSVPGADDEAAPSFVRIRQRPKKTTWPWLLVAMVVIIVISVVAGATRDWGDNGSVAGDLGYGLGASIIPAMLLGFAVYGVLYFAVVKRSNRDNGGKYLTILVVTALLSGVAMSTLSGLGQRGGVDGELLRTALNNAYAEQEVQRAHIEGELAKADPDMFKSAALKRRGGYARAFTELDRRRGLIDQAVAADVVIGAKVRRAAESAVANPAHRARMLAEFDAGYRARAAEVTAFWDSQRHLLDLTEAQLAFLQRTTWTAQGENYLFYRQSDLDAFNSQQAEVTRLTQESAREAERLRSSLEAGRREVDAELARLT